MKLLKCNSFHFSGALGCRLIVFFPLLLTNLWAKSPAPHGPVLEQAAARSNLIMVARVASVRETTIVSGGKAERVVQTFEFEPVITLKGIFVRDMLSLTSEDLGQFVCLPERDQLRLLLLGRSGSGYQNVHRLPTLDESLPLLESPSGPLFESVKILIAVTQEYDRAQKVDLLVKALATGVGPSAIPLLESLRYRALLAAQHPEVASVTRLLSDASPGVRAAAARTVAAILELDYSENAELSRKAVAPLVRLLEGSDPFVPARVAALDALAAAQPGELVRKAAGGQLQLVPGRTTFVEEAAVLRAIGQQVLVTRRERVAAMVERMQLDAPYDLQEAAEVALIRLDSEAAARILEQRIQSKRLAGFEAGLEIRMANELPPEEAVSLLLKISPLPLARSEKTAFAIACQELKDSRLVSPLASLLDPRLPDVHWQVVEALGKIDSDDAAEALRPYLPRESNLYRKLEMAEFLGRHGRDDGYPYALEHMSEPYLLEPSIAVLAAISSPESIRTLRAIVKTSNDTRWKGAAIRALGALGDRELIPQLLEVVEDLRNPLASYALVALGDLDEPKTVRAFREGIRSRDEEIILGCIRGSARLLASGEIEDDFLREELAALLASTDVSEAVRSAALKALLDLQDHRLNRALAEAVLDATLEGSWLLEQIEELIWERKTRLPKP